MRGPLFVDVLGLELGSQDRELLAHQSVGGVTLFARNFVSPTQLSELCEAIRACGDIKIAVDHEGGRVQRFVDGFTRLPAMAQVGGLSEPDASDAARAVGVVISHELRQYGLDLSFAPVVDLAIADNLAIGSRAFAAAPDVVVTCALALAAGLAEGGFPAVAKHFPGHGSIRADSHVELPLDERELTAITDADLLPFAKFAEACAGAIMTAHIRFPAVCSRPVTFSSRWLREVLRGTLEFDGLVFSDDLGMRAARSFGAAGYCVSSALAAGCDVVLVCNDWHAAMDGATAIEHSGWQADEAWRRRTSAFWGVRDARVSAQRYRDALHTLAPLVEAS